MAPRAAWRMLDIEPTADRRAVRRAYAAKLKAIDPDRDIDVFLKLRDALATAEAAAARLTAQAARLAERDDPEEDDDADTDSDRVRFDWSSGNSLGHPSGMTVTVGGAGSGTSPANSPPPARRGGSPAEPVQSTTRAPIGPARHIAEIVDPEPAGPDPRDAVAKALFGQGGNHHQLRLVEAVKALLADDRMDGVGYAAETEEWLAYVLTQAGDAADPVLPLVARHFNWAAELGVARQRPMIARAAARAENLRCADMLRDPEHHWHEAFVLLQRSAPRRVGFSRRVRFGKQVAELIESLRYYHPDVEGLLDADHVGLWTATVPRPDHRPAPLGFRGISWYGWLVLLWLVVLAARLILWVAT